MIIINLKNYKIGNQVIELAKKIEKYDIIIAVPAVNIKEISEKINLNVYSQHVDYQKEKSTGFIIPESIKKAGASGSLLNHSEHPIKMNYIKRTIERCNKLNLKIIVFVSNLKEAKKVKKFKPYAIAYEDPKLIATGKSITKHKTNDIRKFVKLLKNSKTIPLCGSGISSIHDYKEALKLGCKGVLVSSIIAKSKNLDKFLKEVCKK